MKIHLEKYSALMLSVCITANVIVSNTYAEDKQFFEIRKGHVGEALKEFILQTNNEILFTAAVIKEKQTKGLHGNYTEQEALELILKGTDLTTSKTKDGILLVQANSEQSEAEKENNNRRSIRRSEQNAASLTTIEEILVTASKRATTLQDTPMAISALSGDIIGKRNLVSMDDYLRNIPGVSMQERGAGQNSIVIRGMATNPQLESSTSGAYFGEVPTSNLGSASQSGSAGNADLKLIDIERVEVLRGSQGTLYGSGSLAGTVRIVPNAPKLDKLEGSIATRFSNTAEKGSDNTAFQGVINIPLIKDKLAIRGVAYRIDNSGFIDNVAGSQPTSQITEIVNTAGAVAVDRDDRGSDTTTGFRLAALWQVTDEFDVTLSYITQDIEQDGLPEVNLDAPGDFQQYRLQVGSDQNIDEYVESELDLFNLVMNYDLGWGELTSSTSWIDHDAPRHTETSPWAGGAYFNNGSAPVDTVIEELRFSSKWEGSAQLVMGLYYEDREAGYHTVFPWMGEPSLDPAPGTPRFDFQRVNNLEQQAVFGELNYAFSDRWTATMGVRHFDYDVEQVASFSILGNVRYQNRRLTTDEEGQIYKSLISFTPSDDLLVYGQWAQGFRLGRAQNQTAACTDAGIDVPGIDSDTTETVEIGIKSSMLGNRINLNAAIYHTDWDDIPVLVRTNGCNRGLNAGKAQSEGVEIELQALLASNLQLDISASIVDATLEETSSIGEKGQNLPGSADYNANVGLEYGFSLANYPSFVRIDYAYVGEYYNNLDETGTAAGDFGQIHAKLGASVGPVDIDMFVNNLTNDDGLTWVEEAFVRISGGVNRRAYRIRPRTIGMNIRYGF